jgi:brefeldin A-resistance guanine nucleotide exchange factor 1
MISSTNLPSQDDLKKIKHDKKILKQGSELFNQNPSLGITFLQENQIFNNPLQSSAIIKFLRDNPMLDKKIIGEYLSNRKNLHILGEYVK